MFPQQGPYGESCSVSRASGLLIHLYVRVPRKEPSHEIGENTVTIHGASHRWQTYLQRDAAWFPKGKIMGKSEHFYSAIL
jgi:hypothetical protein